MPIAQIDGSFRLILKLVVDGRFQDQQKRGSDTYIPRGSGRDDARETSAGTDLGKLKADGSLTNQGSMQSSTSIPRTRGNARGIWERQKLPFGLDDNMGGRSDSTRIRTFLDLLQRLDV